MLYYLHIKFSLSTFIIITINSKLLMFLSSDKSTQLPLYSMDKNIDFYHQLFDKSPFPSIIIDSHLKVVDINQMAVRFLEEPKDELIGNSAFILLKKVKVNTAFLHKYFHDAWNSEEVTNTTFFFHLNEDQEVQQGEMLLQKINYNGQEALCILCKELPIVQASYSNHSIINPQDLLEIKKILKDIDFNIEAKDIFFKLLSFLKKKQYLHGGGYYKVQKNIDKAYLDYQINLNDSITANLFELDTNLYPTVFQHREVTVIDNAFKEQKQPLILLPIEGENSVDWVLAIELTKQQATQYLTLFNVLGIEINRLFNQNRLIQARNIAEKNLDIKRQFFANMNHEIRTPMNGLIGMMEILSDTYLTPHQKDLIQTMKRSSETLLSILNDILMLSKLEVGKVEIKPQPVALEELLERLYSLFLHQASVKNTKLLYRIHHNVPNYIWIDETRLLQILSNLVSNAIKFTENGTVKVLISEVASTHDSYRTLRFEVIDTGIGISEENQGKLFDSFYQIDNAYQKSYNGTGLGLSISKELCKLMGGEIGVKSQLGKGSNFWFTINVTTCTAKDVLKLRTKDVSTNIAVFSTPPSILVVDDTQTNLTVAQHILQKANCTVTTINSGIKAIEIVKAQAFDLILMDIQMPVINGIEATAKIREILGEKCPPIIAISAFSQPEEQEKFIKEGVDDCVAKPISPNTLIAKLHQWLAPTTTLKGKQDNAITPSKVVPFSMSRLSEVPLFNQQVVQSMKQYMNEDFWQTTLHDFCEESAETLAEAETALRKQEYTTIKNCFHKLKGSSGVMGLERMQKFMEHADEQAKQQDFSLIAYHLAIAKQLLREVNQHLGR
jgi:signal transduction histidine kinase/CheY-like chemotaxis protein/HPt (histidine-containing phosphotransfer) domain-containing protein